MRFSVESWSPEYGVAADEDRLDDASERVAIDVERPTDDWAPIPPRADAPTPERILFVDGVRRIDARVWIHDGDRSHVGVCASVAAGVVTCVAGRAEVTEVLVDRGMFAPSAGGAGPIVTRHATYRYVPTPSDEPDASYLAIHEAMTGLELRALGDPIAADDVDTLVVFDGPLRGRSDRRGVGYVKTQHVQYLPDELVPVLGRLAPGERTPLFLIGAGRGFTRYSWYQRMPGPRTHPLAGVVRCELPGVGVATDAVDCAERIAACLPRFASEPHKDARAPQNLTPIAGLEATLRRRLGDPLLLERGLRLAAAAFTG